MILESTENPDRKITINVILVTYCTLAAVPHDIMISNGFLGQSDMINGMKKFYNDITWDSLVTCVMWEQIV